MRVKRIVSNKDMCDSRLNEMSAKFRQRGYSDNALVPARARVDSMDRDSLLIPAPKKTLDRAVFVTTYNSKSAQLRRIILRHWHMLQGDVGICKELRVPPIFSYKRGKNLRDYLVRADLRVKQDSQTFLQTP